MFQQMTLEEFKAASHNQKRAVVFQEFPCDEITPIHAFLALATTDGAVLLESAIKDQDLGRYSLIAIEPFAEFRSKGNFSEFILKQSRTVYHSEPYECLRKVIENLRLASHVNYPPLVGGTIGFISYDAVRLFEDIPDRHADPQQIPDLFFLFHTVHIAFDHLKGRLLISVNCELTEDVEKDYALALTKINSIRATINAPIRSKEFLSQDSAYFQEEISDVEFCDKIKLAKEYIRQGEAFQIVLSRTFHSKFSKDPFDVYRALRMTNPSPFMFFMRTKDFAVAGSSPERLIKMQNDKLQTMPIAGTKPRIHGKEEETAKELLEDPKEDAEHMMLVDLGRNDLGIIAKVGTVKVKELKVARYFPHVIHLVSQIEAQKANGVDALSALKACFPAGTLSGAPKIRAMQIIDELEGSRRGLYGGAICTIDNKGDLDSCIVIRTAFFKDGVV
jgi:anthranilate synthase component 1